LLTFAIDRLDELAGRGTRKDEFARDTWRLRRVGVTGPGAGWLIHFEPISQPWLREAAKRFLRWRLNTGHSPSGIQRDGLTLTRVAQALTDVAGPDAGIAQFTRPVIERLLGLLVEEGLVANGRSMVLSSVRVLLQLARQHDWLPGRDPRVGVYSEDVPQRTPLPPRALSEFVMAQLEDPAALARIPDERCRLLFPLLMQTGLRQKDGRMLPLDCVVFDAQKAPYMRYFNHKIKREALVPIAVDMAAAIAERQALVLRIHPDATHLFAQLEPVRGRLNLSLNTIKRYARATEPDRLVRAPKYRPTLVDPYRDHLRQRREQNPATAILHLFHEIRNLGYTGSLNLLHKYINQGRVESDRPAVSPRRLTSYLLTHPEHRGQRQQTLFESLTTACPEMTALTSLIPSFAALLQPATANADRLTAWINAARQEDLPHLHAFTRGLDRDRDAVDAAVTLPHHNGTTEGINNKTKLLKRQMYGRAGFTLLRHRILLG
jgi:site-specific recombinase XerD